MFATQNLLTFLHLFHLRLVPFSISHHYTSPFRPRNKKTTPNLCETPVVFSVPASASALASLSNRASATSSFVILAVSLTSCPCLLPCFSQACVTCFWKRTLLSSSHTSANYPMSTPLFYSLDFILPNTHTEPTTGSSVPLSTSIAEPTHSHSTQNCAHPLHLLITTADTQTPPAVTL